MLERTGEEETQKCCNRDSTFSAVSWQSWNRIANPPEVSMSEWSEPRPRPQVDFVLLFWKGVCCYKMTPCCCEVTWRWICAMECVELPDLLVSQILDTFSVAVPRLWVCCSLFCFFSISSLWVEHTLTRCQKIRPPPHFIFCQLFKHMLRRRNWHEVPPESSWEIFEPQSQIIKSDALSADETYNPKTYYHLTNRRKIGRVKPTGRRMKTLKYLRIVKSAHCQHVLGKKGR